MGFGSAWAAAPSCGSCIASRARSSYLSHPSPVLREQRVQCLSCVCALGWCCGIAAVLVWFEARLGQAARSWWNLNSSSSLLSRTLRLVARCLEATAQSKGALAGGGCSLGCSGALGSDVFMWAWEDFPEGPPAARVFLEAAGSGVLRNCVELDVGWEGGGGDSLPMDSTARKAETVCASLGIWILSCNRSRGFSTVTDFYFSTNKLVLSKIGFLDCF